MRISASLNEIRNKNVLAYSPACGEGHRVSEHLNCPEFEGFCQKVNWLVKFPLVILNIV